MDDPSCQSTIRLVACIVPWYSITPLVLVMGEVENFSFKLHFLNVVQFGLVTSRSFPKKKKATFVDKFYLVENFGNSAVYFTSVYWANGLRS